MDSTPLRRLSQNAPQAKAEVLVVGSIPGNERAGEPRIAAKASARTAAAPKPSIDQDLIPFPASRVRLSHFVGLNHVSIGIEHVARTDAEFMNDLRQLAT